jgi:FkbM family methyltransferase
MSFSAFTSTMFFVKKRMPLLWRVITGVHERVWHFKAARRGTFSQHGEDRFLLKYFHGRTGIYIDVGASHPFKISSTYLLYRSGWSGLTLEPIPELFRKHKWFRPRDTALNMAAGAKNGVLKFSELSPGVLSTFNEALAHELIDNGSAVLKRQYMVEVVTLAEVQRRYLENRAVDLLSIDTEGFEMEVLGGIDWSLLRPRLIVCESQSPHGSDLTSEIEKLLVSKGYRRIAEFGCNVIFENCLENAPGAAR